MSARYDADWINTLLDENRLDGVDPKEILADLGIRSGQTVVDYGCGPGYFTLAAAQMVGPTGRVFGIDIESSMVSFAAKKGSDAGFTNVELGLSDGISAPVPDSTAHYVVCALVMHYRETHEDRISIIRDVARILRPNGAVMFIQWKAEHQSTTGISYNSLFDIASQVGLVCDGPYYASDRQYKAIAKKR